MHRTRRSLKAKPIVEESSESEDEVPLKKLKAITKKTETKKDESANHTSSSSESDIENYLQPIDKLDLSSEFFNTEKKNVSDFENIEKDIFTGVTRLSDSSDSEELDISETPKASSSQESEAHSSTATTNVKFQELEDYTRKIEEAKKQVEIYNAKKSDENTLDIGYLLAAGESKQMTLENIKEEDLHSSDFETTDDDWEEVKVKEQTQNEPKEEAAIPKDGIQITIGEMPDTCKKKKGVDLLAAMKRRLNRIRKENQVYVHKVHLLCWIAHGNYVNKILNDMELLGLGLSLLPSDKCYPSDRTDIGYLEQIVNWYKKTILLTEKTIPKELELVNLMKFQIKKKQVFNKKMYVLIFIIILRALGIQCRLVMSLQVEPLRPPANELHSLSKESDDKSSLEKKSTQPIEKKSSSRKTDKKDKIAVKVKAIGKSLDRSIPAPNKLGSRNKDVNTKKSEKTLEKSNKSLKKKPEKKHEKTSKKSSEVTKTIGTTRPESIRSTRSSKTTSNEPKYKRDEKKSKNSLLVNNERKSRSKSSSDVTSRKKEDTKTRSLSSTDVGKPKKITKRRNILKTDGGDSENEGAQPIFSSDVSKPKKITKRRNMTENESRLENENAESLPKSNVGKPKRVTKRRNIVETDKVSHLEEENVQSTSSSNVGKPKKVTRRRNIIESDRVPQLDGMNDSSDDSIDSTILQVDGADDDNAKKRTSHKPTQQKLSVVEKRSSNRLKVKTTESDSENEFSLSPPKRLKKSPNLSKLKSPATTSTSKQFDVKNDIVNLIKGRIAEQKQIDRSKLARKSIKNTPLQDSDSDSDYMPEPIKKKHHDSDSDIEYFIPKPKIKKRINMKKDGTKIISSDSDLEGKKKKKGFNFWVEVFLESEEKWISADVTRSQVHCINEIYSRAAHPVSYILAWNNDSTIKDVTRRYCKNFNTITRKLRVDENWWEASLKPFRGKITARDKEEDDDLNRQQLDQPLPTAISEYKNHPLYALRRHLLKFEEIYPADIVPIGYVRKEAVYPRNCVYVCKSRDIWLKEAKVVKPGEKPYKIVKARPKYDKLSNKMITDQLLEIFGPWQTTDYEPPTAENGVVPRNAFGNVELFKSCMLPKGTVHLKLAGLNKVCRKLNIDCASAIVGFDFHGGWSHPTYDGFVICEEFEDKVIAAWELEQDEIEKKENEKIEKRVYGNWRKLIKGLFIRERLKAKYDFGGESSSITKEKKKSTNKPIIESDSESD